MEFLNIVEEFVSEIGGKDAVKILNLLKEQNNISEFTLAEDIKMSINQVRNLLYKLNAHNLVYSNRKKDREKGWYIYYWTFNFNHARDLLKHRKEQEVINLKEELRKQSEHKYFVCPNDGIRVELEDALEENYKCTECGSILKQEDSTKKINEIENKLHRLNTELEELNKPIKIAPREAVEEEEKKKRRKIKKVKKKKVKRKLAKKRKKGKKLKKHKRKLLKKKRRR